MHAAACRDILLFPRGNREVRGQGLSLYLNVSDAELAPPGWLRKAQFRLTVVNLANPEQSVHKGALRFVYGGGRWYQNALLVGICANPGLPWCVGGIERADQGWEAPYPCRA